MAQIKVVSPDVQYTKDHIISDYVYETARVKRDGESLLVHPVRTNYKFKTQRKVPRLGCMLVGWGGNNGSTVTGAVIANRLNMTWMTKTGEQRANYWGSVTQASTVSLGRDESGDVNVPLRDLLPMVHPDDIVLDGLYSLLSWL